MADHERPRRRRPAGTRIRRASALPRVDARPETGTFPPGAARAPGGEPARPGATSASAVAARGAVLPATGPGGPSAAAGTGRSEPRLALLKVAVAVLVAAPFVVTLVSSRGVYVRHTSSDGRPGAGRPHNPAPSRDPAPRRSPGATPRPSSAAATPAPSMSGAVDARPPARRSSRPPGEGAATHGGPRPAGRSLVSQDSRRCIDVTGGRPEDGTPLEIWTCTGGARQRWTFEPDGTVRSMGMCMDVAWGSDEDGTVIQLVRCHGGPAQHFTLNGAGDLVNLGSDKCVDVTDMETANGTRLQLWECGGTPNQKWSAV